MSTHKNTYNIQYQTFSQKPDESLNNYFARFKSIVSSLRFFCLFAYDDNERAKQLLYDIDNHV
jgi:predicted PolB exonuclease-like 3'-5' exonuclease